MNQVMNVDAGGGDIKKCSLGVIGLFKKWCHYQEPVESVGDMCGEVGCMSEERGKVVKWIGGEVMGYRGSEVVVGWWDLPDNMSLK